MSFYWDKTEITALEASLPFFFLFIAWFIFKHVNIPFPIGFLLSTESFMIALVAALEIKSKCGVLPLITQPKATNPLKFLMFLEIVTGISNTPGTRIIFIVKEFWISFLALFIRPKEIFL